MSKTALCKICDRPIGNLAKETKGRCPRCLKAKKGRKKKKQ